MAQLESFTNLLRIQNPTHSWMELIAKTGKTYFNSNLVHRMIWPCETFKFIDLQLFIIKSLNSQSSKKTWSNSLMETFVSSQHLAH